ncbi:MAG: 4-hydroxy-tetrahydrodipicolinate synthase [Candidatus Bathyarchaeota archaeon]|nr:4-hydroxy-tetrahydrodipicolinate synthase [Candidatus Termiticorpusculum sp.]MCL2868515.1 4-hydroxy-tetrahydrodipicolinate synthase [Candidatus Termiticorpusculum sp.]
MFTFSGCTTALITPMTTIQQVDYEGLQRLIDFQVQEGVNGLLAVGTTGESPTLNWEEHSRVIEKTREYAGDRCFTIAGTGSNSTREAIEGTRHAQAVGINAVLLVDPYYNGPSSMEIRREYIEPIAKQFPDIQIIPYIIPGRTGTQLFPQDLAILHQNYPNVCCVKEATGDLANMMLTRQVCGENFEILSGDDDKTYTMMVNPDIKATGAISVVSNIAPRAVADMIHYILDGNVEAAAVIHQALQPLFNIVTVKTQESTPYGLVTCRARNPLACKTLMNILGMPSGPCRQPLGKMTHVGIEIVLANARKVYEANPQVFEPIADYFNVDITDRLYNEKSLVGLTYD